MRKAGFCRLFTALCVTLTACSTPLQPTTPDAEAEASDPAWASSTGECRADSPARSLPAERRLPSPTGFRTQDDEWAEIARTVPGGWGGIIYDRGRLVIFLVEPARSADAIAALQRHFPHLALPGAEIRRVRWDFAQLYDWYRYLNLTVWQQGGVTMSDIDEAQNRLMYGVLDEDARERVMAHLSIRDIPCFLAAIQIVPPATTRPLLP